MATKDTIADCIDLLESIYGATKIKNNPLLMEFWKHQFFDFGDEVLKSAVYDTCGTRESEWPPQVSHIRARCCDICRGILYDTGPAEAWMRVCDSLNDDNIVLTGPEKKALKAIGGKSSLKSTNNTQHDRSYFMRLYDELKRRERSDYMSMHRVKKFAEAMRPKIPELPKEIKVEPKHEEISHVEIDDLVKGIKW
jgi:hypothetical protein